MKRKRLLILVWNLGIGGVQKRIRDIAKEISNKHRSWEVYIFVRDRYPSHFAEELVNYEKIHIVYFPPSRAIGRLSSLIWFARQFDNIRPDVCLTFLSYLSSMMIIIKLICFWVKTRVVLNEGVHTSGFLPLHSKSLKTEALAIRFLYKLSDSVIAPTQAVATDLMKNYLVPEKLIKIIPNWTLFPLKVPLKPVYDLIYIGRFEKEKNLREFIEIIKLIRDDKKDIKTCLVGDGSYLEELNTLIDKFKLRNNIKIFPPQTNVEIFLQKSKLFLLPSQNEGMPNVVLEAAMCRTPTVARHFPGSEEVIENYRSGILYDNLPEAVLNVKKLLSDNGLREKMGYSAQKLIAQKFSTKIQNQFLEAVIG